MKQDEPSALSPETSSLLLLIKDLHSVISPITSGSPYGTVP